MNFSIEQTEPNKYIFICFGVRHELTQDKFNELANAVLDMPAHCFTMPIKTMTSTEPPKGPQAALRRLVSGEHDRKW